MQTYPILAKDGGRTPAFEVENAYIGLATIVRLLGDVQGVTDVQRTNRPAKSSDVHISFKYQGTPWIVWEPYGDNSRYWIGPKEELGGLAGITKLEEAFKHHQPPLHRALLGDVLTLRLITRFVQKSR